MPPLIKQSYSQCFQVIYKETSQHISWRKVGLKQAGPTLAPVCAMMEGPVFVLSMASDHRGSSSESSALSEQELQLGLQSLAPPPANANASS